MARARRALLRAAATLIAVGCLASSASAAGAGGRGLLQFGKGAFKDKPVPLPPQPLAMVSQAQYISPTYNPVLEPQFVAPVQGPSLAERFSAWRERIMTPAPAPAPVVQPAFVSPVLQAPVYASGVALPTPRPLVITPVKRWKFPFLTKVLTLGITAVPTPDPVVTRVPVAQPVGLGKGKGAALLGGLSAAAAGLAGGAVAGGYAPAGAGYAPAGGAFTQAGAGYAQPGPVAGAVTVGGAPVQTVMTQGRVPAGAYATAPQYGQQGAAAAAPVQSYGIGYSQAGQAYPSAAAAGGVQQQAVQASAPMSIAPVMPSGRR